MADDPDGSDGDHVVDLDASLATLEDEAAGDTSTSRQALRDHWEAMFALYTGEGDITDAQINDTVDAATADPEGNGNDSVEQTRQRVSSRLPKSAQSSADGLEQRIEDEKESDGSSSSGSGSSGSSGSSEKDNSTDGNGTAGSGNESPPCMIQILCSVPSIDDPRGAIPRSPLPFPTPGWSPATQLAAAGDPSDPPAAMAPQQEAASPATEQEVTANAIVIATAAAATIAATAMVTASTSAGSQLLAWAARWLAAAKRWFWLGLGLYARLSRDQVLDHGTRNQILEFLRANPGSSMTEVQTALQAGFTTIRHHLRVLQSNDLVTDVKNGRRRCFFAIENAGSRNERRATAVLASASAKRVFSVIEKRPGIRQQELAAALNVTSTSVIFHTRRLEAAGIVQRGQSGRAIAYFPAQTATL